MSRTRLTALLVCAGIGAAGLAPATAAPTAPSVERLDPQRGLHAALTRLLHDPAPDAVTALREAHEPSLLGMRDTATAVAEGPSEQAYVSSAGDLDGDRRSDVILERATGTDVRSGKDGRLLLSRDGGMLLPVAGAGRVRLLSVEHEYEFLERGFSVRIRLHGLDRAGKAVWEHGYEGTVRVLGVGPAYVARVVDLPAMLSDGQLDPAGKPALLIGTVSATQTPAAITSAVKPALLSLSDGTVAPLPEVRGVGSGTAWAIPVPAQDGLRSCYGTAAPVGPLTRVSLHCDGAARWTTTLRLRDPWLDPAGDFDGDGLIDLVAGTWGFERPRPREVLRGTEVLSFADGSSLARSTVDSLQPLGKDINRDAQPDFLELVEDGEFGVQAVTLAGERIWRRDLAVPDDWYELGMLLGLDVSGDGVGDVLVVSRPEKGVSTSVVVNGTTGRAFSMAGVDDLLLPGLRSRGADFVVLEPRNGRPHATVLSGDGGRRLMAVAVPGAPGRVSSGGAGAVDIDGNGRRDLVVASRTDDHLVTTAFSSATGRALWQQREKHVAVLVMAESASATCC